MFGNFCDIKEKEDDPNGISICSYTYFVTLKLDDSSSPLNLINPSNIHSYTILTIIVLSIAPWLAQEKNQLKINLRIATVYLGNFLNEGLVTIMFHLFAITSYRILHRSYFYHNRNFTF